MHGKSNLQWKYVDAMYISWAKLTILIARQCVRHQVRMPYMPRCEAYVTWKEKARCVCILIEIIIDKTLQKLRTTTENIQTQKARPSLQRHREQELSKKMHCIPWLRRLKTEIRGGEMWWNTLWFHKKHYTIHTQRHGICSNPKFTTVHHYKIWILNVTAGIKTPMLLVHPVSERAHLVSAHDDVT